MERVEDDGDPERPGELEDAVERPALVVLEHEPLARAVGQAGERGREPGARRRRIGRSRADVQHDLVRAVEAERREEALVVLELRDRGVHHGRVRRGQHGVLARMRRDPRVGVGEQPRELVEARRANSSHQASVFTGCDASGIRFDVSRKTATSCSAFQRRIASSASRFAAISSRRRSGVAFATRAVRADDGSCVLTQA